MADALAHYDPANDLAAIDKQIAFRALEARTATAERDGLAQRIEALKAKADAQVAQARSLRDADSAARATFAAMTPTVKADAVVAAAAQRRTADGHEKQAGLIRAEVATLEPQLVERTRLVDRLHTQQTLLRKAKEDVQIRADVGRVQAASARGEAAQTGLDLDKRITSLVAMREALSAPTQEAIKFYAAAALAAKKSGAGATGAGKTAASVGAGSNEQSRGDVLSSKARSLAAFVALLDTAGQTSPPLPGVAGYKKKAETLRAELKSSTDEAKAAFAAAEALYKSSGGSPEIKPRLDALAKKLKELSSLGEASKPAPEPEARPEPAKPKDPATPADDAQPEDKAESPKG